MLGKWPCFYEMLYIISHILDEKNPFYQVKYLITRVVRRVNSLFGFPQMETTFLLKVALMNNEFVTFFDECMTALIY